ncbi:hypothetical protein J6590_072002 [Homalodisca vitripennis]|nr:hypothetical protein J6590_072002 [Homalodisca vitripennis]
MVASELVHIGVKLEYRVACDSAALCNHASVSRCLQTVYSSLHRTVQPRIRLPVSTNCVQLAPVMVASELVHIGVKLEYRVACDSAALCNHASVSRCLQTVYSSLQ